MKVFVLHCKEISCIDELWQRQMNLVGLCGTVSARASRAYLGLGGCGYYDNVRRAVRQMLTVLDRTVSVDPVRISMDKGYVLRFYAHVRVLAAFGEEGDQLGLFRFFFC